MQYKNLENNILTLDSGDKEIKFDINRVNRYSSSIKFEYKKYKTLFYITSIIGFLILSINVKNNLFRNPLEKEYTDLILMQQGPRFNIYEYTVQPNGLGSSIYKVEEVNGIWYYSKNIPAFILYTIITLIVFGIAFFIYMQFSPYHKNFSTDNHTISMEIQGIETIHFYTGDENKTNEILDKLLLFQKNKILNNLNQAV